MLSRGALMVDPGQLAPKGYLLDALVPVALRKKSLNLLESGSFWLRGLSMLLVSQTSVLTASD